MKLTFPNILLIFIIGLSFKGAPPARCNPFPLRTTSQDSIYSSYRRGLNIDFWQGALQIERWVSSKTQIRITEDASSSRLLAAPAGQQWKDQHELNTELLQYLTPSLAFDFWGSSYLYADKQTGFEQGDIRTHNFDAGILYENKKIQLPLRVGFKEDRRFGQNDRGVHYKIGLDIRESQFGDYTHSFYSNYEQDNLDQRKNQDVNLVYLIQQEFYTDTYDSLRFIYNRQRRDYYISNTGVIESRLENDRGFDNTLRYKVSDHWLVRLNTGLFNRSLNITNVLNQETVPKRDRRDFQMVGSFLLGFKIPDFWTRIKLEYRGEEQTYQLEEQASVSNYISPLLVTPDNRSSYNTLTLLTGWRSTSTDSLFMYSSIQRFRYDTPDENNYDDRDELRIRSHVQAMHEFSSNLKGRLTFGLNLLHIVYILGEKSAENNWARIIRLNPSISWQPNPKVKIQHGIEVLANYVDYDYEDLLPGTRSFLYRKLRMQDSTRIYINSHLSCKVSYQLELDETGKLLWDDWVEQKLIDRQSHSLSVELSYAPWKELFIVPGYNLYTRRGYRNLQSGLGVQDKEKSIDFISHGPVLAFGYRGDHLVLYVRGSTLVIQNKPQAEQILNRLELNMSWIL